MSKLKDKLSANMRMVKANQQPAAPAKAQAAAKPAAKPASKPAQQPAAKPAAAKAVAKPAAASKPEAVRSTASKVSAGGSTLFPARVWPD